MTECPSCRSEHIQEMFDNYFCLDCEWDNLPVLEKQSPPVVEVELDSEVMRDVLTASFPPPITMEVLWASMMAVADIGRALLSGHIPYYSIGENNPCKMTLDEQIKSLLQNEQANSYTLPSGRVISFPKEWVVSPLVDVNECEFTKDMFIWKPEPTPGWVKRGYGCCFYVPQSHFEVYPMGTSHTHF